MRDILSDLVTQSALRDKNFLVLSGDHGYALFDQIKLKAPAQFLNCGVIEQGMVGIAAGLAKEGFRPFVYGLAAFIPVRVLEQIKLDICYQNLPVILLGDGAGLVYSTLGSSHQCAEDVAALMPLPNIRIYSPGDLYETMACYKEAFESGAPSYIRIGKSDRPEVHVGQPSSTDCVFTHKVPDKNICFVSTSSMISVAHQFAKEFDYPHISIMRLKPIDSELRKILSMYQKVFVFDEHSVSGGLCTILSSLFFNTGLAAPLFYSFQLKNQFSQHCGSYQYALSEHEMSDEQLKKRISDILAK